MLCFAIFFQRRMDLDRKSSLALIAIYGVYVGYSIAIFYKDE